MTLLLLPYSQNVTVYDTTAFNSLGLGESGHLIFNNVHFAIPSDTSAFFGGVTLYSGRDEVDAAQFNQIQDVHRHET